MMIGMKIQILMQIEEVVEGEDLATEAVLDVEVLGTKEVLEEIEVNLVVVGCLEVAGVEILVEALEATEEVQEEDEIKMKKWVTRTIRIMPRLAQDHRDPHLEVHSQVIKHLFFRTNADPVPHQSHYFRDYLVLLVSLILSNNQPRRFLI